MDNILNYIKKNVDIISVFVDFGKNGVIQRGVTDPKFLARCSFHDVSMEDKFTVYISKDKGIWFCDVCGAGGDSIAYVARIKNISPMDAITTLIEHYKIEKPHEG